MPGSGVTHARYAEDPSSILLPPHTLNEGAPATMQYTDSAQLQTISRCASLSSTLQWLQRCSCTARASDTHCYDVALSGDVLCMCHVVKITYISHEQKHGLMVAGCSISFSCTFGSFILRPTWQLLCCLRHVWVN